MEAEKAYKAHIVALLFPHQGHVNAIVEFSKRLASKGIKITIATSGQSHTNKFQLPSSSTPAITFHQIFEGERASGAHGYKDFLERFEAIGSLNLTELIKQHQNSDYPLNCLVYDTNMPWAFTVAKRFSLPCAAFFTQSCTTIASYYPMFCQLSGKPLPPAFSVAAGLPQPRILSVPAFGSDTGPFPLIILQQLSYYNNVDKADWVLFNSFDELETEAVKWLSHFWAVTTIGPSLPSFYLDRRIEDDDDYCFNLYTPNNDACTKWLDSKPTGSVVYVSFGSVARLSTEQMEELGEALKENSNAFLWVVRPDEESKVPVNFVEETSEKGLVVSWCSQLVVLAHHAVGCFVSHCGWSSTMEAISCGVPIVAVPQFLDQMTNAHFIEKVWGVGVEAEVAVAEKGGLTTGKEISRCIDEVMCGEKGKGIKRNAMRLKELAKEAVDQGGSSDKYIEEIIAKIVAATS